MSPGKSSSAARCARSASSAAPDSLEDFASHKLANDEGDDVEGHSLLGSHKASHKLANDEGDDDVEGHMHLNAHKASHKL